MSQYRKRFRTVRHAFGAFRRRIKERGLRLGDVRRGVGRQLYKQTARIAGEERVSSWAAAYRGYQERFWTFVHQYIDPESWYYPYLKFLTKGFLWGSLLLGIYVFVLNYNFLYLTGTMPSVEELKNPKLNQASEIYSQDKVLIGKFYAENRTPIKFENIPKPLINALIATEDARFYEHGGIDPRALGRAIISFGRDGGGSTITQQLAKNLFKTRRKSETGILTRIPFVRKIIYKSKEWLMALKLERNFSKNEIITYYFNTVDFGSNAFGLKTAARTFFNKVPDSLNVQEGAVLVGLQKATTSYNPLRNPNRSKVRRNVVIGQMAKYNFLTKNQADSISALPLETDYTPENPYSGPASYLKNAVEDYVSKWGEENGYDLNTDGLRIITTIDSKMQTYAEEATGEKMKQLQRTFDNHWRGRNPWTDEDGNELPGFIDSVARRTERYKTLSRRFMPLYPDSIMYYMKNKKYKMRVFSWNNKKGYDSTFMTPYDSIAYYKHFLQAGMVAMDPHTGYIRAWVGGLDYDYFKYDHVKQGKRQPGSTFKPFVYTTAIDDTLINMAPCDRIQDKPFRKEYRENGEDKVWEPRNSVGYFSYSNMTLRRAMARSVNSITAQLTDQVTPERVVQYARRMGIKSRLQAVPSIGLGSSDVSLYELVGAYCTFANDGETTDPLIVQRIEDRDGNVIETFTSPHKRAISPETAFLMRYMLQGGLQESGGTSQNLWSYNLFRNRNEIGAKTGTTSNNSDGWFVAVSNQLVVGAWVGGDDRSIHFRSTDLGEGAKTALPLVGRFLEKVYTDPKFKSLQQPFPKGVGITKNYLDCGYDDEEESTEESDSTDTGEMIDSTFFQPVPIPDAIPLQKEQKDTTTKSQP
ncbi:transglycosylase domain-containing protein [Spirosoma sp. BT702]|uniref:Transglycosylase domain-containing protein n=1 Tax=Spirosoma profusum TaxID=2771354 RepID=A0A927ASV3_9BACT|nr:transglycosylase domain-containing protein [Spirosoma profusum]MBD2701835.1 transglycosylase domain-containing protein [Spirosoma profusum]